MMPKISKLYQESLANAVNEEVVAQVAMDLFVAHSYQPKDCFKLAREFLEYREAERQRIKQQEKQDDK